MNSDDKNIDSQGGLLRISEAALVLGVSQRTVWRMVAEGQLKAVHVRGCTRIYRSSLDEYLKKNERVGCV